ncbi:HPP family protein [Paraburkholderia sp. B3]|uniref:HPP family protein n=1 Tax=Paraburkholderia sp. B3 TaxID=3134791 RepID=UPI00398252A6
MGWLSRFAPVPVTVKWPERLRAGFGALLGLALTGALMHFTLKDGIAVPLLVAPMGASAVLLFGVPASPLAQPWSIIGGNLVSATVGVTCGLLIDDPVLAAAIAAGVAIAAMFTLRCVHPPSGAVALTAVLGGPAIHSLGYGFVLEPIAAQSFVLLGSALAYHAITGHRYPHAAARTEPNAKAAAGRPAQATQAAQAGFSRADLEAVLKQRNEMLDIAPEDLEAVLREAQIRAYARTFSELSAADVMSRDVISITPDTTANAAWELLTRHGIKALPVIDAGRQVIGIVTRTDLADNYRPARVGNRVERLVNKWFAPGDQTDIPVSRLMTLHVRTVHTDTPIVQLVTMFADMGHHHIPIVDRHRQLAGIITQADLIAGLYRQTLAQESLAA